jgi:dipeptidyl aminopeptidase/acylaminoacyl peptidase
VAAAGPADLTLDPGVEVVPRFLGATYAEDPARFRAASPILHVSADDPPVFLYHGTEDRTVSPDQSRNFKAALDRAGVRAELYWVKGRGHAGVLWFNGGAEAAAIDFLDSVLR